MNKQEVIDEIENAIPDFILNDYQRGKETGLTYALELVEKLDEPEKPVIPQYVADMIVKRKRAGQSVIKTIENLRFYEDACKWVRNNGETFFKAWLYGYEIEKEKLYTVKFANKDFGKIYIGIFKAVNKLGISSLPLNDDDVKSWFTEDELKKLKFWKNPAFEIEEVKK